jgi:hypothetical protein
VPQPGPRLTIAAYRMMDGSVDNRIRWDEDFILAAGGEMTAAATARRDVMVVCLQEGFKACDALIWTLCQQDVAFVGFLRQVWGRVWIK